MSRVFTAHAVSVDGYISGRTSGGESPAASRTPSPQPAWPPVTEALHLLQAVPAPGVTHLHYEVVR